jgi:pseudouridine synthase
MEGKNRQIRRMCKALGYLVARLIRVRIDTITIGDLKPGEYREYKI